MVRSSVELKSINSMQTIDSTTPSSLGGHTMGKKGNGSSDIRKSAQASSMSSLLEGINLGGGLNQNQMKTLAQKQQ